MVVIVGGAAETFPDSGEVWTVGRMARRVPSATRLYELHAPEVWQEFGLEAHRAEVWGVCPSLPRFHRYPFNEVRERFGINLDSTISLMVAHAILEGHDLIEVVGAPLTGGYAHQRLALGYLCAMGPVVYPELVNLEMYGEKVCA